MRRIFKKLVVTLIILIVLIGTVSINEHNLFAATANVNISSATCYVGEEVSITINVASNEKIILIDLYVQYDSKILEPISGYTSVHGDYLRLYNEADGDTSFTIKFKGKGVGRSSIRINTELDHDVIEWFVGGDVTNRMDIKQSTGSVTVNAPVSYSADNTLKSLSISPGALTPAFASSIYDYTVSVGENDTRLTVSAVANHSNAKVSITGNTDLKPGSNTVTIMVTAENGERRNYTIKVNKPIPETTAPVPVVNKTATIDGVNYEIIEDYSSIPLPENFALTEVDYNGQTVTAGKHAGNGLTIMYLQAVDDSGRSSFYVYDTVSKTFSPYIVLGTSQPSYVVLSISDNMEKPDGYSLVDMTINDMTVKVLKNGNDDFYLFYGMNSQGSIGWYSYDIKENTVQRYAAASGAGDNGETQVSNESNSGNLVSGAGVWKILAVIMTVIAIIMVIITAKVMTDNKKLVAANTRVNNQFDENASAEKIQLNMAAKDNASEKKKASGEPQSDEEAGDDDFEDKDILLDEDILEVSEVSGSSDGSRDSESSEGMEISSGFAVSDADVLEVSGNAQELELLELSDVQEISLEALENSENADSSQAINEEISLEEVSDLETPKQ